MAIGLWEPPAEEDWFDQSAGELNNIRLYVEEPEDEEEIPVERNPVELLLRDLRAHNPLISKEEEHELALANDTVRDAVVFALLEQRPVRAFIQQQLERLKTSKLKESSRIVDFKAYRYKKKILHTAIEDMLPLLTAKERAIDNVLREKQKGSIRSRGGIEQDLLRHNSRCAAVLQEMHLSVKFLFTACMPILQKAFQSHGIKPKSSVAISPKAAHIRGRIQASSVGYLPKPLSVEGEHELGWPVELASYEAARIESLCRKFHDSAWALVAPNARYVVKQSGCLRTDSQSDDDPIQKGMLEAFEVAKRFKGSKNTRFTTYVHKALSFDRSHEIRKLKRIRHMEKQMIASGEYDFFNTVAAEEESGAEVSERQQLCRALVEELLACLHPVQLRTIRDRFGLDDGCEMTYDEVAQRYGTSEKAASQAGRGAFRKLLSVIRRNPALLRKCEEILA